MAIAALLLSFAAVAGEPDAGTKREISHLMEFLGASGCQFNRNGTWYDASQAVSHLTQKYEYLVKRGLVTDADGFIARAASESSASGKPYLVKCGDAQPVQSGRWFRTELARFRAK
jgi:Family of unknown function (DUF5329)